MGIGIRTISIEMLCSIAVCVNLYTAVSTNLKRLIGPRAGAEVNVGPLIGVAQNLPFCIQGHTDLHIPNYLIIP